MHPMGKFIAIATMPLSKCALLVNSLTDLFHLPKQKLTLGSHIFTILNHLRMSLAPFAIFSITKSPLVGNVMQKMH